MGREAKKSFPGAGGTLLRDREQTNRFISFGPWESVDHVAAWRKSPAFRDGVARIPEVLGSSEPHALDLVTIVE